MTPRSTSVEAHTDHRAADTARAAGDVFVELGEVARAAATVHGFYGKALRCIARAFASSYAAIYVREQTGAFQDDCHFGADDPGFWKPAVQPFLTESLTEAEPQARLLSARSGNRTVALLAAPLVEPDGSAAGAVALVTACRGESHAGRLLARLEALVRCVSFAVPMIGQGQREQRRTADAGPNAAIARVAGASGIEALAFSMTNSLRNNLGCEQVALGLVEHRRVRIVSISGLDEVKKQSPGVIPLRESMEECLDADTSIVYQHDGIWSGAGAHEGFLLHRKWHAAARGDAVATLPLHSDDRVVAVIALRRRPEQPFTPELIQDIRKRVEPYGPALVLVARANRTLPRHAADAVRGALEWLRSPGRVRRPIGAVLATAFVLWFLFGTLRYELNVPAVVAPLEVRHVTAPDDGVLLSAAVKAGDVVRAGDLLCALDTTELEQERVAVLAEIAVFDREADQAMAVSDAAAAQLSRARRRLAETHLAAIERKIEDASLRAPVDGVVMRGDLSRRTGSVVTRGEPFFEIAPLDRWTLELYVPDAASEDLAAGLSGSFATMARPERAYALRVNRVRPLAELHEEKNVFVAEADLAAMDDLRPGMEGIASVTAGRKPVWWLVFHRVIDYARLNWWL